MIEDFYCGEILSLKNSSKQSVGNRKSEPM